MGTDQGRAPLEAAEGVPQRAIAFAGGAVEAVVSRQLPRDLPHPFSGVKLRGVSGKAMQLDFVSVLSQPLLPGFVEVVAGAAVDDEEHLPRRVLDDELQQEVVKGMAVEDFRKPVGEVGVLEGDGSKNVSGLSFSERVNPRLNTDARPCLVERPIEPEARLILENHKAAASCSLFLEQGTSRAARPLGLPHPRERAACEVVVRRTQVDEAIRERSGCGS